jgi:hypothetical protein
VFTSTLATQAFADPTDLERGELHYVASPEPDQLEPPAPAPDPKQTTRESTILPFGMSPRVSEGPAVGHVTGGYDGGHRTAVADSIAEANVTRYLAIRAGVSSNDLWGRTTGLFGLKLGLLRQEKAPIDLALGVFYQPQAIQGDGQILSTLSLGRTFDSVSPFLTLGYGRDPEGDDQMGLTSLGAVVRVSDRFHLAIDSRARFQLASTDAKFANITKPVLDFVVGPLVAYSLGPFDFTAQGGLSGLAVQTPADARTAHNSLTLGPLALLGVGATL